jgi:uncharacterized protein
MVERQQSNLEALVTVCSSSSGCLESALAADIQHVDFSKKAKEFWSEIARPKRATASDQVYLCCGLNFRGRPKIV